MIYSVPLTPAALSAAKPTLNERRAWAAGQIAHLAIQAFYRIEHPHNFIITERSISRGDTKLTTVSRFADLSTKGYTLAKRAADLGVPMKAARALSNEDFWAILVYLLDLSTDFSKSTPIRKIIKRVKKRYDILDFGPIGTSMITDTAQAYEIKSLNDLNKGSNYIKSATNNFNNVLDKLTPVLQTLFNVSGLAGYKVIPGTSWPHIPHLLPIGPNVLMFGLVAPGVICYEWLNFKRVPLKKLWNMARNAANEVRSIIRREGSWDPMVIIMAMLATGLMVTSVALVSAELVGGVIAAGSESIAVAVIPVLREILRRAIFGLSPVILLSASAAKGSSAKSEKEIPESLKNQRIEKLVNALNAAYNTEGQIDPSQFKLVDQDEERSGGTGPTEGELAVEKLSNALANQFLFLYAVQIGQGNDIMDDAGTEVFRQALHKWLQRLLSSYGLSQFLELFGEKEINDESAFRIAQIIIMNGGFDVENNLYGSLFMHLATISDDDILESLPEDCNDDGESESEE